MGALFVTATGTDIGKTFVTAGIVRALRRRDRAVAALKPIMSGFSEADVTTSDAGVLLRALGRPVDMAEVARIAPWRFVAPLSPDMAARREGRTIAFEELLDFTRGALAAAEDMVLIEGVGGVMVPLNETRTVADWMAALRVPAVLVAGSYLGTISHTLTALEALRQRSIPVAAILISETPESAVDLDETQATVSRFAAGSPVLILPRLTAGQEHPVFDRLVDLV
ncbi:MAG TPA: dethiobiotin synthase [Alphaproteobacteria bacterium]|nr:dethiobiotin synthase [Alphaproteobacteria bacterium]